MHKIWVFVEEARMCHKRCIQLIWQHFHAKQPNTYQLQYSLYNEMHSVVSFYRWCFSCTAHGVNLPFVRYLPSTQEKRIDDFYSGTKCSAFWIICQGVNHSIRSEVCKEPNTWWLTYKMHLLCSWPDHSHVVQLFQRHAFLSWWILFWVDKSEFHLGTKHL
jgi:hypothetical protein